MAGSGKLLIHPLRDELRKVFKITNLEKMFEFYESEEKALSVFGVTTAG